MTVSDLLKVTIIRRQI